MEKDRKSDNEKKIKSNLKSRIWTKGGKKKMNSNEEWRDKLIEEKKEKKLWEKERKEEF